MSEDKAKTIVIAAWSPIETAPHDGTNLLCRNNLGDCQVMSWRTEYDRDGPCWYCVHYDPASINPTHWVEIPKFNEVGKMSEETQETSAEERTEYTVLGRVIGTATGWDGDGFDMVLHDFIPSISGLPSGSISVAFEAGTISSYDEDGKMLESVDIVTALAAVPLISNE
jgi:hypothetical protein